ncbi:MAG: tripartite tricarboxylate transporter substrate binding protein [Burkholderiales bacterium]|nr:tripartite tricarboxylate transporter substrate binding protein [Burkholderiales bacterium]
MQGHSGPALLPVVAAVAGFALTGAALAQGTYPEKVLRLVVGFSAGGPTDLPARFVADRLGAALGQRVIVENRPGAAGQIATQDVLSKPRDGYNLLLCTHFESINAAVHRKIPYKLSDIAPISQISRYYYAVTATRQMPAQDWDSFLAYAKTNRGKVNYITLGRGSAQEILALELGKLTGIEMYGVPYKQNADMMNDMIAGRVQIYVGPTLSVMANYKAGKLGILAVSSPGRLAAIPEVPTLTEKGLPFVRFGWLGICAASGTPEPIIALLNRRIADVVKAPDYRDMIEKAGSIPLPSTPEELRRTLLETYEQTAAIAREFGIQVE